MSSKPIDFKQRFKKSLLKIKELNTRLDAHERSKSEPIAIVGLACRFPGGADTPEAFWKLLQSGKDAVGQVPEDRWPEEANILSTDDSPSARGKKWGGFLDKVDQFDPTFFGISPRETVSLDPQHRLLMEVSWEALERSGYPTDRLMGSKTGVFIGTSTNDYHQQRLMVGEVSEMDAYSVTGSGLCFSAGRLSYTLGLQGPAVALDTACSSSLVATHLACQSLRSHGSDVAIAGGVNLIISPLSTHLLSQTQALSPDGRCKAFDSKANGFVRGEGCGLLVLKRLSDAQRDGDKIWALVRGSAVNQDGRSTGLTAPNVLSQQSLLRQALRSAKVEPNEVTYIEAHGTGTSLGDPIEVDALKEVLGSPRDNGTTCLMGSVKTNIGHCEAASGAAGMIKVVLAMQHKTIPKHMHFKALNPRISLEGTPFVIPTKERPWNSGELPRIAGVSSFGMSGTNAHIILAEAPEVEKEEAVSERPLDVITLSAKSQEALQAQASALSEWLEAHPDADLGKVAHTTNTGRTHFEHRLAVLSSDQKTVLKALNAAAAGKKTPTITKGKVRRTDTRAKVAFLFTGQGSQYVNMGQELYQTQPVFKEALDACDAILKDHLPCPLLEVLYPAEGKDSPVNQTRYTQPALFAIEYAMAKMWMSWGIQPDVVLGHSVGEYGAACIAGLFSLEDGLKLIAARGRLMQALPEGGAMVSLRTDAAKAEEAVKGYEKTVSVAAYNGPASVVLSGAGDDVRKIAAGLAEEGIKTKELVVSHAFHSPLMDPMLAEFKAIASAVTFQKPKIQLISNLVGALSDDSISTAEYWTEHVRAPVKFAQGMQALSELGCDAYLEVGPSPTLVTMGMNCISDNAEWIGSLRAKRSNWKTVSQAISKLYVNGASLDWAAINDGLAYELLDLPTYAFQRKRFWFDPAKRQARPTSQASEVINPLVGGRISLAGQGLVLEADLNTEDLPFLADHQVFDQVVVPATAYLEMARTAGRAQFGAGLHSLQSVVLQEALMLSEGKGKRVQIVLGPENGGQCTFAVFSQNHDQAPTEPWVKHVSGVIHRAAPMPTAAPQSLDLDSLRKACPEQLSVEKAYETFNNLGISYGPAFQGVTSLFKGDDEVLAQLTFPEAISEELGTYGMHPALLDAAIQALGASLADAKTKDAYLPFGVEKYTCQGQKEAVVWVHAKLRPGRTSSREVLVGDVVVFDNAGNRCAEVEGLQVKRVDTDSLKKAESKRAEEWLYDIQWRNKVLESTEELSGNWLIFSDKGGLGTQIASTIRSSGGNCTLAMAGDSYKELEPGLVSLNGADLDQVKSLVTAENAFTGALFLWGLDSKDGVNCSVKSGGQDTITAAAFHLAQTLVRVGKAKPARLFIATKDVYGGTASVSQSTLWGFARVISLEHPELKTLIGDLDGSIEAQSAALLTEMGGNDGENQVQWRKGQRSVARLVKYNAKTRKGGALPIPEAESYRLDMKQKGVLDHLELMPVKRQGVGAGQVEISVKVSGLNFRDVLNALDMYPGEAGPLGGEFAGTVTEVGEGVSHLAVGDDVMGVGPAAFSPFVLTDARYVIKKPDNLSFEEAASIPIVFLTAWYGLYNLGKMEAGHKVLIHAAAGGVGMAAVQLAQLTGAEVFGTASTPKWDTLKEMGVPHIMNSRTLEFADQIKEKTGGEGIDIVLNALAGDFIPKSLGLLKSTGRFLEMGKAELWNREQVDAVNPGVYYKDFDLVFIDPDLVHEMFQKVSDALGEGKLRPLPTRSYNITKALDAFRFMAQAKHIGKVVLNIEPPADGAEEKLNAQIQSDASYLITGGFGALGQLVAGWLVERGARNLVLMGRSDPKPPVAAQLQLWKEQGVQIHHARTDVSDHDQLESLFNTLKDSMPALKGIYHAAGVLDDGVMLQQSWDRFVNVMAPKVDGAWSLHTLSKDLSLDAFVLFSSAASLLGSPGQSNYAAANAFMDGLAHARRAAGLPGTSLNWGPWANSGMAADTMAADRTAKLWATQGWSMIQADQGLHLMELAMIRGEAQLGVLPVDWAKMKQNQPAGQMPALFEEVAPKDGAGGAASVDDGAGKNELLKQLRSVDASQHQAVMERILQGHVGRVLQLDNSDDVDVHQPLADMGFDSLMAVELRNAMSDTVGQTLPATMVFDYPTLADIGAYLLADIINLDDAGPEELEDLDETMDFGGSAIQANEPIAIVGMGCRLPGNANSPGEFWENLLGGKDAIVDIPKDRWDIDEYYDPDPLKMGKMYIRQGGFIQDVDQFEAKFFGIRKSEATSMDPQQRILLEVTWEALEHAGIAPASLMGTQTGVYVGICSNDYGIDTLYSGDALRMDFYTGTGNISSVASGRLSYTLGLQGPCMALDTACSSSLVALHLAVQSLRTGESNMALVGGVNLMLSPEPTLYFSRIQAMSADGRCKTFDKDANGYVRSEGCGVVVLKRLSEAQRDGDRIMAVVNGTAVNQDGRSNGLTAPNGPSQQSVIRRALNQAGIKPAEVDYVESHGTGTALGDPIEVQALGAVLKQGRPADNKVVLGAVKTNIGHLEGAAGIAGLIKTTMALYYGKIPQNLHFNTPSPHIPWAELPIEVPTKTQDWPHGGQRRVAGLSSFGMSGTNAHAILSSAPSAVRPVLRDRDTHLMAVSAKDNKALRSNVEKLNSYLESSTESISDICYTTTAGRNHFKHRMILSGGSKTEFQEALGAYLADKEHSALQSGTIQKAIKNGRVAFSYSNSYIPIQKEFFDSQPVFRESLEHISQAFGDTFAQPLSHLMFRESTIKAEQRAVLFATQLALTDLWKSWGFEPAAILGHGDGELAASVVAGVLDLDAAVRLLRERARLLDGGQGDATTFEDAVGMLEMNPPKLPYSSGLGTTDSTSPDHWRRLVDETGSLEQAQGALANNNCAIVLNLASVAPQSETGLSLNITASWPGTFSALQEAYVKGATINWRQFDAPFMRQLQSLPTYAFQRKRYWVDASEYQNMSSSSASLLGTKVSLATGDSVFESKHKAADISVTSDEAMKSTAEAAATELFGEGATIEGLEQHAALEFRNGETRRLQVIVGRESQGKSALSVFTKEEGNESAQWLLHASATLIRA